MKKSYIVIAIIMIASLLLGACAKTATTEAPVVGEPTEAPVVEEPTAAESVGTLRIWGDEQRAPVLNELAAAFKAEYGVELVVENISGIRDQFVISAPAGEGPDIIIVAHD
jgi:maltose-binding protein MalE